MEMTGLKGYVHEFSVHCDTIDISDIEDIHKYLMEKHDKKCLDFLSKYLLRY